MSDLADRLTPPRETRTPQWHYEQADRLVAELDDMQPHELVLPHGKSKMVLADLHARLAGCALPDVVAADERRAEPYGRRGTCYCAHCDLPIGFNSETGWFHIGSGVSYCYRDPQHTETATPNERI